MGTAQCAKYARSSIGRQLQSEWQAIGRSTASAAAARALADVEPTVAAVGAADLAELVEAVQAVGRGQCLTQADKPAVVAAMLHSAGAHELIPRALVQTLYPGLTGVVRALGGLAEHWGTSDDAMTEAVFMLWTVLDEWAGAERPYATLDVLSAVRCRMRRAAFKAKGEALQLADPSTFDDLEGGPTMSTLEQLAMALDHPDELGLASADAAAICLTRVHGYSLEEAATIAGSTRGSIQHRRDRGERCLVA